MVLRSVCDRSLFGSTFLWWYIEENGNSYQYMDCESDGLCSLHEHDADQVLWGDVSVSWRQSDLGKSYQALENNLLRPFVPRQSPPFERQAIPPHKDTTNDHSPHCPATLQHCRAFLAPHQGLYFTSFVRQSESECYCEEHPEHNLSWKEEEQILCWVET